MTNAVRIRVLTGALAIGVLLASCAAAHQPITAGQSSNLATGMSVTAVEVDSAGARTPAEPAGTPGTAKPITPTPRSDGRTTATPTGGSTPTAARATADFGTGSAASPTTPSATATTATVATTPRGTSDAAGASAGPLYAVAGVVDGDTINVRIGGAKHTIRIIGVDTPELHKPGYAEQCYAQRAASRMQSLVQSKQVRLQADGSQADVDQYGRLLRHVLLPDGTSVALMLIREGLGREYTFDRPYNGQRAYRAAEATAKAAGTGLWRACGGYPSLVRTATAAPKPATTPRTSAPPSPPKKTTPSPPKKTTPPPTAATGGACVIKGNINSKGEKIYHLPKSHSYDATKINTAKGERWFCTEPQAKAAGWRAARD